MMNESVKKRTLLAPSRPGVYIFKDAAGNPIYIGKAKNLAARLSSYRAARQDPKTARMLFLARDLEYMVLSSETEALTVEASLIKRFRPRYNILLRDDKRYPYLKITRERYPRILVTRRLESDGGRYFGPYPDVKRLRSILDLINRRFGLRRCRRMRTGRRPCIYHEIGECGGPCAGREGRDDYNARVDEAAGILSGGTRGIARLLEDGMKAAAERLDFEEAALIRDEIRGLRQVRERRLDSRPAGVARDAVALFIEGGRGAAVRISSREGRITDTARFEMRLGETETGETDPLSIVMRIIYDETEIPREILVERIPEEKALIEEALSRKAGRKVVIRRPSRGAPRRLVEAAIVNAKDFARISRLSREEREREEALLELEETLGLERRPARIEGYDISTTSGRETVASRVYFSNGIPDKSRYRRYRIRGAGDDDTAAMAEAIRRRAARMEEDPLPDLILVDGGEGQIKAALSALGEASGRTDLLALAKKNEEIRSPKTDEIIVLERRSPALKLLQRIRDEAHRFARGYHTRLRDGRLTRSSLLDLPGIGRKRAADLLRHFGSARAVIEAPKEELIKVRGIGPEIAERIKRT